MKTIREVELEEKCRKLEKDYEKALLIRFEAFEKLRSEKENLKTALDESQEVVISYKEENDRLNNIIDELEKYMIERRLTDIDGRTMVYQILYKLNELKGDNK